jgi:hypothetical protein
VVQDSEGTTGPCPISVVLRNTSIAGASQPRLDSTRCGAMGVEMIVNFRDNRAEMETEKHQVESLGIKYVEIPWSANHEVPSSHIVDFSTWFVRTQRPRSLFIAGVVQIVPES